MNRPLVRVARPTVLFAASFAWAAGLCAASLAQVAPEGGGAGPRTLPPIAERVPEKPAVPADAGLVEVFPGVRVDVRARVVEFDGEVPIRVDDPRAPRVYLEQVVCIPDTKEHEVLVVADVQPSHVHAALLAIGLTPGKPASYRWEGTKGIPVPADGDAVSLELSFVDRTGVTVTRSVSELVTNARTSEAWPDGPFVFAGSVMRNRQGRDLYEADGSGTLIGLTSFGTEVVSASAVFSPDSQIEEPVWIANVQTVPPMGTKVTVRLKPAAAPQPPAQAPEAPAAAPAETGNPAK